MKSYEDTNDVMSMENKFDNFLKNFSNSGGNAGNMIVGNIKASNCVCVVTNAKAPNAVVA